jgi:lipopolysaccharide biosynthesis protein
MPDVCIFAHYDRDGVVDPHVLRYLAALRDCGFHTVFVTASGTGEAGRRQLLPHCIDIIERDNVGHDFGSWSTGLARWRDRIDGRLLLANDSVYGPLLPLKPQLDRLTSSKVDFYGMVCNREVRTHLQSWFLLFEPRVVRSETFAEIFCQPPLARSREEIIEELELTATERLAAAGFAYSALHMPGARTLLGNPTVYLWRELIEKDAVPFLKVGVLRQDPVGIFADGRWRDTISRLAPDALALIDAHRARMERHPMDPPGLATRLRRRGFRRLLQLDDRIARTGSAPLIRANRFTLGLLSPLLGGKQRLHT